MNNTSNNDSPKGCIIVFVTIFVLAFLGWGITTLIQSNSNPYKDEECYYTGCSEEPKHMWNKVYYCENHYDSDFRNYYGTPTTKCGDYVFDEETASLTYCNKYIAKTGDTRYCEEHSHKCAECYCYIDQDAMYCMDCLEDAFS